VQPHHPLTRRRGQGDLVVTDHPHGLVSLFDDEMRRTMAPAAAIELAVRLIQATRSPVGGTGPLGETN
jgi:hypothetical protein